MIVLEAARKQKNSNKKVEENCAGSESRKISFVSVSFILTCVDMALMMMGFFSLK